MIKLLFRQDAIPRTTTRDQWRAIHRWRRVTERQIAVDYERSLQNVVAYGTSHPEMMERIVNPPILLYPMTISATGAPPEKVEG